MSRQTSFLVDPDEDWDSHEARWNTFLRGLHDEGLTIRGRDADNDEPLRTVLVDGLNPTGPYFEVYGVVALETSRDTSEVSL